MPVVGTRAVTTAVLSNAWATSCVSSVIATIAAKQLGRYLRNSRAPDQKTPHHKMASPAVPASPSSSPTTAKTKSVFDSGRKLSFCEPRPRPTPHKPPAPSAMSDCFNCQASLLRKSVHTETKSVIRRAR